MSYTVYATYATGREEVVESCEFRDQASAVAGQYQNAHPTAQLYINDEPVAKSDEAPAVAAPRCATCGDEGDCPDCDTLLCNVITCSQLATHFSASGTMPALCCACFVTAFGKPCGCGEAPAYPVGTVLTAYRWQPSYHRDDPPEWQETEMYVVAVNGTLLTLEGAGHRATVEARYVEDGCVELSETESIGGGSIGKVYAEFADLYGD